MVGNLKVPTKMILAIFPPSGGLVRSGGDYTESATGAFHFDPPLSPTELIVGTYTSMSIHDKEDSAAKFEPNGRLEFASGTSASGSSSTPTPTFTPSPFPRPASASS